MSDGMERQGRQRRAMLAVVAAARRGVEEAAQQIMTEYRVEGAEMIEDFWALLNDVSSRHQGAGEVVEFRRGAKPCLKEAGEPR